MIFSKETADRVKLAKQYIYSKYERIIETEYKSKQNWNKILSIMGKSPSSRPLLEYLSSKINENIRKLRQKDCLQNYKLFGVIGRGAFGYVRLARHLETNQVVAIKRLYKSYLVERKQVYNAYIYKYLMTRNPSNFIITLFSTFQDSSYLYICMEFAQGGDLLHLLIYRDILTEEETKFYVAEMVQAVEAIHKNNYIHRDIKPDNILIAADGHIRVSDFGLSKYLEYEYSSQHGAYNETKMTPPASKPLSSKSSVKPSKKLRKAYRIRRLQEIKNKDRSFSKVGTPDYISPEVLTDYKYTHSVDLWGIGVIMFECLFGYPPFSDETSKYVCHKVANWVEYLEFPTDIYVSTAAKMLILGLVNDKNRRLTIYYVKAHPFFYGVDWNNLHKMKPPFVPDLKDDLDSSNFDSYELKTPWTEAYKYFLSHINNNEQKSHVDSLETEDQSKDSLKETLSNFKFAGFDFKKCDEDPVYKMANYLMKNNIPTKNLKKVSSSKKITSFRDKPEQKFKLMKPKSASKNKMSFFLNMTEVSSSGSRSKLSPSKQFLKTLYSSTSKYKENSKINLTLNSYCDTDTHSFKKKLPKYKAEYLHKIYRQFEKKTLPKNKSKNNISLNKSKSKDNKESVQRSFF